MPGLKEHLADTIAVLRSIADSRITVSRVVVRMGVVEWVVDGWMLPKPTCV